MEYLNIEYIAMITGFLLMVLGIWAILTQKNLIKIVIGFTLFDTGLNTIIVSLAYIKGRTAPILDSADLLKDTVNKIVDPVPQALVLTAIVIGLGVTALMLAYVVKMHKEKGTLDIKSFNDLKF